MTIIKPVAHYKMNDDAATLVVVDSADPAHNGTATQNTEDMSEVGKINKALDFGIGFGEGESVALGTPASLMPPSAFTLSAWIYRTNNFWSYDGIISSPKDAAFNGGYILCGISSGTIGFLISNYGWHVVTTDVDVSINTWTLVTAVWDGSNMYLYINGVPQSTVTPNSFIDYSSSWVQDQSIGTYGPATFPGYIDDVRIYDVALSPDEIGRIYNDNNGTEDEISKDFVSPLPSFFRIH